MKNMKEYICFITLVTLQQNFICHSKMHYPCQESNLKYVNKDSGAEHPIIWLYSQWQKSILPSTQAFSDYVRTNWMHKSRKILSALDTADYVDK